MGIESIVILALAAAVLVGLALYASNHRAEDDHKDHRHDPV
jgi:hypothetical protein